MIYRQQTKYRRTSDVNEDNESSSQLELLEHRLSPAIPRPQDSELLQDSVLSQDSALLQEPETPSDYNVQKRFSGWRVGVTVAASIALCVMLCNIGTTIYVMANHKFEHDGKDWKILSDSSCDAVKNLSRWIHLLINVLSTILLAASNYCMQVLCSPTKAEISKAHRNRIWLHIGVPNTRNLWYIGRGRMLLWTLLLTSSVPLHFLFNSVVFARIQANDYQVLPVTDNFFNGHNYDTSEFTAVDNSFNLSEAEVLRDKFKTLKTDNLTAHECLEAYNSQYVSQHGDVLIFQNQIVWHSPANYSPVWNDSSYYEWVKISWPLTTNLNYDDHLPYQSFADVFPANGWRCPSRSIQDCHITRTAEIPANGSWAPYGSPVSHCLVEKVEEVCKLQFSLKIAIIVIICNFVKVCCMFTVAFRYYNHYVVTVGDAISYFLDEPEAETKGRCIHERRDFRLEWEWKEIQLSQSPNKPRKYNPEKLRWYNAANGKRWIISYLSYWGSLVFAIIAIDKSLAGMPSNIKDLWATGFGQLQGNNLLHTRTSIMGGVLLANAPQVILSYLYVSFNALLTRMLVQRELACYKQSIKPLRVTFPTGQQRSTFWLQLPYRYAIPLNITSVLLHWLASQSLFMVSVTIISRDRKPDYKREISTCGYSPVAIIFTTCVGCIIMISGIVMAYRKFPGGMPLMSSSSAAISAACHPPENDTGAAQLPVQWGVAKEGQGEDGVGHITFTSFDVTVPIPGKLYA